MDIYSKSHILLLVQVDHLSGEVLGYLIDCFYKAGAKNVQIIPSITKKNRPGNIILIDINPDNLDSVEEIIVKESGSSGWHRIDTRHCYVPVDKIYREITIFIEDQSFVFTVSGKLVNNNEKYIRPEFDDCKLLKEVLLTDYNKDIPFIEIYTAISNVFSDTKINQINF
jgi:uncharacterized protein (DUF111 family)